jgi:hypothetical protein
MDSFYVILSVSPGHSANDLVSVGMITWANGRFQYCVSWRKLKLVQGLFTTSYSGLKWSIDQITSQLDAENTQLQNPAAELAARFGESYFEYLARYANGLVRFSAPKRLHFPLIAGSLDAFFAKTVDADWEATGVVGIEPAPHRYSKEQFRTQINDALILPLSPTIHTHYHASPEKFPELFFNVEIDCIGKNGVLYAAKALDFENVSSETQDRNICHYILLIDVLEKRYASAAGKNRFFIIADEPREIGSPLHRQWEAIQKLGKAEVVPLEATASVTNLILESKATKFF